MSELFGTTIGNFRIEELIGTGGMSQVYRGSHVHLERVAAIKVMHAQFSADPSFQERFLREAIVASHLHHPNIVEIYDTGVIDGAYYIAMAHIEGKTLSQILTERLPSMTETVGYVRQVAAALDHAHERGVIHRDVKPSNVIVQPDGTAVLVDFGIAKALEEAGSTTDTGLTLAGSIVGTPAYLAPEQAGGEPVTARTDIYALGCVTYELLSGQAPFAGRSFRSMVTAHISEVPLPVDEVKPELNPVLGAVVARTLAKDPEQRYATAGEFAAALSQAAAPPITPAAAPITRPEAAVAAPPTPVGATHAGTRRPPWLVLGAIAALAVGGLLAGLLFLGSDDDDGDPTATALVVTTSTSAVEGTEAVIIAETATSQPTPTRPVVATTETATADATATSSATPTVEPSATTPGLTTDLATLSAMLVFQSSRDLNFEIYVMNADGTEQTNLSNEPSMDDLTPAWSPDGTKIAWARGPQNPAESPGESYEIWVMNADGTGQQQLTDTPGIDINPSWSPDGLTIVFDSDRDGNKELYAMNADGTDQRRLTNNSATDERGIFSPDGSRIAFQSNRGGSYDLWLIGTDGGNPTQLTSFPEEERFPTWSPDGTQLAFNRERLDARASSLFVMNADGSDAAMVEGTLAVDAAPAWSPDGTLLVFQSFRDGNWNLFAVRAEGGEQVRLTESPGADMLPAWSPLLPETASIGAR